MSCSEPSYGIFIKCDNKLKIVIGSSVAFETMLGVSGVGVVGEEVISQVFY